jgi:kynurenine 3-monooxygenase
MNTALADAAALNRMLDENNDDWDVVLPLFSQERVKEGHALTDLSFYTFSLSGRQQFSFMIRQTIRQTLNRWLPFLVDPDPMAEVSKGMKLSEAYYRMNKIHKVIPVARTVNDEIMREYFEKKIGLIPPDYDNDDKVWKKIVIYGIPVAAVAAALFGGKRHR